MKNHMKLLEVTSIIITSIYRIHVWHWVFKFCVNVLSFAYTMCICVVVHVCSCGCVHICIGAYSHLFAHKCIEAKNLPGFLLHHPQPYSSRHGLSLNLVFIHFARVAAQGALGISLSLPAAHLPVLRLQLFIITTGFTWMLEFYD